MERADARDLIDAWVERRAGLGEAAKAEGVFTIECVRRGLVIWRDTIKNTVVTVGKNLMLDTALAGSGYTVTGPYLSFISSVGFTAIAASDTMASHPGWLEAGNANAPQYTGPRKTALWSAASGGSKALSSALSFAMTASGTIKGGFLVFGSGASATIDDTGGTLYSAGLFTGGDKTVSNGDLIGVNYSTSL